MKEAKAAIIEDIKIATAGVPQSVNF